MRDSKRLCVPHSQYFCTCYPHQGFFYVLMKATAEQQKVIDLIKSGDIKNLRLAFDLNTSQQLGVDLIYANIYEKWADSIMQFDSYKDLRECFPILSTQGASLVQHEYKEDDFKDGIDGICELLKDTLKYFYITTEEHRKLRIVLNRELEVNDYQTRYEAQLKISKATGIKPSKLLILDNSNF